MKPSSLIPWTLRALSGILLLAAPLLVEPSYAQQGNGPSGTQKGKSPTSLTQDWSDQHAVFSAPASPQAATGLQQNHRYQRQLLRQSSITNNSGRGKAGGGGSGSTTPAGDWSVSMGRSGSRVAPA